MSGVIRPEPLSMIPAAPGWRAVFLSHRAPGWRAEPLIAWVLYEFTGDTGPFREICPAVLSADGQARDPGDLPFFWYIARPGDPDPAPQEAAAEHAVRAKWKDPAA
jgi:hypothetical protein